MSYETITVDVEGSVATVTLCRPDALNAITVAMLGELNAAVDALDADPEVAVVVLTGEGRAFSAGVDLKALAGVPLADGMIGDLLDGPARRLTGRLATLDAVVIAKVNGFCFTGALELAMACDVLVCAEEAVLGDTHAKFGLRPTWGMSQRLPMLVGIARARELSYSARTFTGADAAAWGLAARVCPRAELDDVVASLAAAIASHSRGSLRAYKDLYGAYADGLVRDGLRREATTSYVIEDTDARVSEFRN